MEWFLNDDAWERLQEQIEAKQEAPETAGTAGQVLGLANIGGQLVPVWITVSGGGITIDDALSTISENPVQNKVITGALNTLADGLYTLSGDLAGVQQDLEDVEGDIGNLEQDVAGKVDDVQVNGTSVVSQGVANVPIASANDLGVSKVYYNGTQAVYGIGISNGFLFISEAPSAYIKIGSASYRPIVPAHQHESAFYGLAKASGDTTQSASANPVGQYTDDAKAAILAMLGVLLKRKSVSISLTINAGDQSLVSIPTITGYVPVFTRLFFTSATGASHKLCVSGLIYQSAENRIRIFNTETSGSVTFTGDLQVYYLPVTAYEEVV